MQSNQQQNEIKANPIKSQNQDSDEQIQSSEDLLDPTIIPKTTKNTFKSDLITCKDYKNKELLVQTFPHLKSLEEAQVAKLDEIEDAYAFIIRSNNDDDIHKAIKYGIWSSTPPNNEILNESFMKANKEDKRVFLFYSVVKSGQFVGAAELISNKHDDSFEFWWQHGRWKGLFEVKWLFIKDIPYKHFDNLQNAKDDPVIRSKDGTPVDWKKTGKKMMKIFSDFVEPNTIFNDFVNMDIREQYLRFMRNQQNQNMQLQQQSQVNYQGNPSLYQYTQQGFFGMQNPMYMGPQHQQQQMFQQIPRYGNAYPPQYYQSQYNNGYFMQQQHHKQPNYYNGNNQGQRYGPRNSNYNQNRPNYYRNNNNQYNNNNNNNNNTGGNNNNNTNNNQTSGNNYPNNGGGGYPGNRRQNRQQ